MQLHGDDDGEAASTPFFPTISRAVHPDEWLAMFGIAPITTDEGHDEKDRQLRDGGEKSPD